MTRLIDADELLKHKTDHEMISTHLIYNAPTVDAKPVIHAEWIRHYAKFGEGGDHRECSNCGVWLIWDMPRNSYCPNCGAKMDKENKDEQNR